MGTAEETYAAAGQARSTEPYRLLVVDDEPSLAESCSAVLSGAGYHVRVSNRADEAMQLIQRTKFDVALIDLFMPQVSGLTLLQACLEANPETLVIIMTGNPSVESSIDVLKAGAWDYLPKPFTATHLQVLLGRAIFALNTQRNPRQEEPQARARRERPDPVTLLGNSPAFLRTMALCKRVAQSDASVFLTGESGSGKELIAQYIHENSRRARGPMVAVNCAALPESLLESEMFGHVKGAFTGATRDKPGLLKMADGGTFFLDEFTEMSLPIQSKLLRVVQDGLVRRVGGETADARVSVRFISATNRDPRQSVEEGALRKDLFYRLSVVPIHVPSLRERPEDIPLLAEHSLAMYWKRHREKGSAVPHFSRAALEFLRSRPWTGNVRELQNVIEHAVILLDPGQEIMPDDIPYLEGSEFGRSSRIGRLHGSPDIPEIAYHAAREQVLADFEILYITRLIERAGANMSQAAKIAGVDRTTLYRLMEKHGLARDTVITMS